jgi:ACT domain-containing protein
MGQIPENLQTLFNNGVRFRAFDVCDKTDATSVVFIGGIIQSLGTGRLRHGLPRG